MINISENTIDKLMEMDGDFSKLYLYMIKNQIKELTNENKKEISQKTFITYKKMDYIVNYYKFNGLLPKSFNNSIGLTDQKESVIEDIKVDESLVIELNNYAKETFNTPLDYSIFFKNSLKKYDFNKEIYMFLIDACGYSVDYQNIAYMDKVLSDWKKNEIKTKDDAKNYLNLKNFDKSNEELQSRHTNKLSDNSIKDNKKWKDIFNGYFM